MKSKRILLTVLLLAVFLTGCRPLVKEEEIKKEYNIFASFYPVYALSGMIIDNDIPDMNLYLLVQPQDGCLRSYSLSDRDLYLAAAADAVILSGNGLESFESVLTGLGEEGPAVISITSGMILEKMNVSDNTESHFSGVNPWVFLSVDGACEMLHAIAADMAYLDPAYESAYMKNLAEAQEKMTALKASMTEIMGDEIKKVPIAVAHEGLILFANDWQLNISAYLQRESGVMPDDSELDEMLEMLRDSGAKAVLVEKQAPEAFLKLLKDAGYRCVLMDTLSTGNAGMGAQGYFDAMIENAKSIAETLKEDKT